MGTNAPLLEGQPGAHQWDTGLFQPTVCHPISVCVWPVLHFSLLKRFCHCLSPFDNIFFLLHVLFTECAHRFRHKCSNPNNPSSLPPFCHPASLLPCLHLQVNVFVLLSVVCVLLNLAGFILCCQGAQLVSSMTSCRLVRLLCLFVFVWFSLCRL